MDMGATGDDTVDAVSRTDRWSVVYGVLVSLVIVTPTFFTEEFWHGAPLIDRGGTSWLVPAAVMAVGFFLGGLIAGYRRPRLRQALAAGLVTGGITIVLIFAADLVRRAALGQDMLLRVMEYWVGAMGSSLLVGGLGGVSGYWLAGQIWAQRSVRVGTADTRGGAQAEA
jgi:hypothetical protein